MTRVVKIGGRVQGDPLLGVRLAECAHATPGGLVVVHGGGDDVSALQRRLGLEPRFVSGRRVTTSDELEIVRMVLSGTANKRLVGVCQNAGLRAVGISGEDGGVLAARVANGAPLGRVGERAFADASLLRDLLERGWIPVVSPLARDADSAVGEGLNVNGDDAAAAIAVALEASELVFVADVRGVLVDGVLAPSLSVGDAHDLVLRGTAAGGMAAKLHAGCAAVSHGVRRVRITDLAGLAEPGSGTTLLPTAAPVSWQR